MIITEQLLHVLKVALKRQTSLTKEGLFTTFRQLKTIHRSVI